MASLIAGSPLTSGRTDTSYWYDPATTVINSPTRDAFSPLSLTPYQAGLINVGDAAVSYAGSSFGGYVGGSHYGTGTLPYMSEWLASGSLLRPTSTKPSPFENFRVDMGGIKHMLSRDDPRYTANEYQYNYPGLYSQWKAGQITDSQLFSRAMSQSVQYDYDTLYNNVRFLNYDRKQNLTSFIYGRGSSGGTGRNTNLTGARATFNSSGGGGYSGTGISYNGLSGSWTGYKKTYNFGF